MLGLPDFVRKVNQAEVATLSRNYQTCDVIYTHSTKPNCNGGQCHSIRLGPKQGCGHHSGIPRLTDSSSPHTFCGLGCSFRKSTKFGFLKFRSQLKVTAKSFCRLSTVLRTGVTAIGYCQPFSVSHTVRAASTYRIHYRSPAPENTWHIIEMHYIFIELIN